jgi:hypothetical protein
MNRIAREAKGRKGGFSSFLKLSTLVEARRWALQIFEKRARTPEVGRRRPSGMHTPAGCKVGDGVSYQLWSGTGTGECLGDRTSDC